MARPPTETSFQPHSPRCVPLCPHQLGTRLPLTGVKIPKIGKRGFQSQKNPFSPTSEKGALSQKIPVSTQSAQGKWGFFLTQNALSGVGGGEMEVF